MSDDDDRIWPKWNPLQFLRILDDDHKLSLTNIAVIIVLVKIAQAHDNAVLPALLGIVFANYSAKKVINLKASDAQTSSP